VGATPPASRLALIHSPLSFPQALKPPVRTPIILLVVDSPRSRRTPHQALRTELGNSSGPGSRKLDGSASADPASRPLDSSTSPGPASRVIHEGNDGAPSRTLPDAPRTGRTQVYEILHLGDTDLVACVGPCLVVVSDTLTLEGVDAMGRAMTKLTQRYGKLSSLSFLDRNGGPKLSAPARDGVTELVRKHAPALSGSAVVCEGTGFRATAVRSIVTAIYMASRATHPSKVFAAPEPAIEWLLTTRSDGAIGAALLLETAATLRAKLQARLARVAARDAG
jgi:hypothetical protein